MVSCWRNTMEITHKATLWFNPWWVSLWLYSYVFFLMLKSIHLFFKVSWWWELDHLLEAATEPLGQKPKHLVLFEDLVTHVIHSYAQLWTTAAVFILLQWPWRPLPAVPRQCCTEPTDCQAISIFSHAKRRGHSKSECPPLAHKQASCESNQLNV